MMGYNCRIITIITDIKRKIPNCSDEANHPHTMSPSIIKTAIAEEYLKITLSLSLFWSAGSFGNFKWRMMLLTRRIPIIDM